MYAYQEAILDQSDFTTHLNQGDVCVTRDPGQIRVRCRDGDIAVDRLIIATTPGAVNRVLRDADDAENACFAPWQDQIFKTVSHTSLAPYGAFQHVAKSPMDMFLSEDGLSGYNTYLNGFYDIAPSTPYSFAYGLDRLIDPADILDVQDHTVPVYTPSAYAQKERIPS